MISIVVARSRNGAIGRDGGLPWRLPSDLKRFRELTEGHTVVMGRRTFESLPEAFRPLPRRRNIVLSRDPSYSPVGAEVCSNLADALAASLDCFVIGGGEIYTKALPVAERVYATEIDALVDGDVFFPELAPRQWRCVERGADISESTWRFAFCVYERPR
jgi:dihydrofolate reductase